MIFSVKTMLDFQSPELRCYYRYSVIMHNKLNNGELWSNESSIDFIYDS